MVHPDHLKAPTLRIRNGQMKEQERIFDPILQKFRDGERVGGGVRELLKYQGRRRQGRHQTYLVSAASGGTRRDVHRQIHSEKSVVILS